MVIWRLKSVDTKLISSGIITLPSLKFIIFLTIVTYLTLSKSPTVVVCGTCMNIWTLWWLCSPSQVRYLVCFHCCLPFRFFFRLICYRKALVFFETTNCTRPTGSRHFVILKNIFVLIAYVFHGDQTLGNSQGKTFSKKGRKVEKLYFVREIVRLWEMSWKSEIPSERNSFSLSWLLLYERWQRLTFCDVNVTRKYCTVYLIDPCKHTVSLVM